MISADFADGDGLTLLLVSSLMRLLRRPTLLATCVRACACGREKECRTREPSQASQGGSVDGDGKRGGS